MRRHDSRRIRLSAFSAQPCSQADDFADDQNQRAASDQADPLAEVQGNGSEHSPAELGNQG